jgi:hypothetical protein
LPGARADQLLQESAGRVGCVLVRLMGGDEVYKSNGVRPSVL